jgi:hypothetical protein
MHSHRNWGQDFPFWVVGGYSVVAAPVGPAEGGRAGGS